jgi:TPR repeat protein
VAPLTETAPPAPGAGSAAASSGPAGDQPPDQGASSEAAASQDVANPGPIATPTPAVGAGDAAASSGPVWEQSPDQGASSAASRDVANAGSIAASPSNEAALAAEEPSTVVAIGMAHGDEAIARGDVISARHFYELAASHGLAQAAAAVGRTYDPIFLQAKGARGALADAEAAKRWYQKAIDGGDVEARVRLHKLLQLDKGNR